MSAILLDVAAWQAAGIERDLRTALRAGRISPAGLSRIIGHLASAECICGEDCEACTGVAGFSSEGDFCPCVEESWAAPGSHNDCHDDCVERHDLLGVTNDLDDYVRGIEEEAKEAEDKDKISIPAKGLETLQGILKVLEALA